MGETIRNEMVFCLLHIFSRFILSDEKQTFNKDESLLVGCTLCYRQNNKQHTKQVANRNYNATKYQTTCEKKRKKINKFGVSKCRQMRIYWIFKIILVK